MTKKKPVKKTSPRKTAKSSGNGSSLTFVQSDGVADINEALGELTFLIVGLLKGAAPHLDEEEAFDFLGPRLLEGMSFNDAVELGALLCRTTPDDRKTLQ